MSFEGVAVKVVVRGPGWNFIQHLLEMTIAMFVGMFVLGMPAKMLFESLGWTALTENLVLRTLLMATYMSIGIAAWMRFRGCRWRTTLEMCLAMYVPFLIMYPPYFAGWASPTAVMVVGHVLMTPAMIMAMLFRLDEYTGTHRAHKQTEVDKAETKVSAAQPEG
jgi:flagellar biosynthetic protein FliP